MSDKHLLSESLSYKDMVGLVKPTIHIDEFSSKMGDDDDIVVVSFFIRDAQAAKDLVVWFEKGYDFILDASRSPGELKPNRYLVYVEMRRRSDVGKKIYELIDDLGTLTEWQPDEWTMHYDDKEYPFSVEQFDQVVPRTAREYRNKYGDEGDLNEMRIAAGLNVHTKKVTDPELKHLQALARI